MLIFIFCSCSCLFGFVLGGILVDSRRRRELEFKEKSVQKLREFCLDYVDQNKLLNQKLEIWKKTAKNLEDTLAQVSGTPKKNFGKG